MLFDLRSAGRALLKDPVFTSAVVIVLALGLAVNTTIFTIVNGMTWRSLPVADGDRIVLIESLELQPRGTSTYTSMADFEDWRGAARTLTDLAAYRSATMNLGDDTRAADRLAGSFVTSNLFQLLGVRPVLGRDFAAADDEAGAPDVVILGHHVWTARYASDATVVGRTIRINGQPTMVIGIMPPGFQFPLRADAWRPVAQMPGLSPIDRRARMFDVVGRLRDGVTVEKARAELDAITAALAAAHPDSNRDVGARTVRFTHGFVAPPPEAREPLVMMSAAALVLIIACANGANLLLCRAARRVREIAMRATLGASRARLARQLLLESLAMAVAAGFVGLALSVLAVRVFRRETLDMNLPFWIAFEFDARVFAYVAGACLGTAVLFGLMPAWQLARTNAHEVIKDGGRGAIGGGARRRLTGMLLVGELALTLTLLGVAAVLLRSSEALAERDAVLDLDRLFSAHVGLPASRYDTPEKRHALHSQIEARIAAGALPSAALSSVRPFVESNSVQLRVEGARSGEGPRNVQAVGVGQEYFEVLGIPILRGRALAADDGVRGREAIVINERFAEVFFAGADPLGRQVIVTQGEGAGRHDRSFTIVGVSQPVRQRTMSNVAPLVYLPLEFLPGPTLALTARSTGDHALTTHAMREVIRAVDPDVAAYNIVSLRRLSELSRWPARVLSFVMVVFAAIASVLAAAGLYAIAAYGVSQRTSEIGLRLAVGATRWQIGALFARSLLAHLAIGFALGMAGVVAAGQVLAALLVRTAGVDAALVALIVVALTLVTGVACFVPIRRAMALDPVAALRRE
jgi:putative ABC transport system permease protein